MNKLKIALFSYLYPSPVVLIGANVYGKPNFVTIANVSVIGYEPYLISISSYENHYTNIGIKENGTFSVNTPSEDLVVSVDYCGIVSGKEKDKSKIFDIFYGELKTAPMISNFPLNLECKVIKTIKLKELVNVEKGNELFIGQIVGAYAGDDYLIEGEPDMFKLKTFTFAPDGYYWKVGERLAQAREIGKNYII